MSVFKAAPYSYVDARMKRDLDNFVEEMTGQTSPSLVLTHLNN